MNLNSTRVFTAAVAGGVAGLVAFGILEPSARTSELAHHANESADALARMLWMFGINGTLTGLAIAVTDELTGSSGKRILVRAVIGALLGLAFGAVSGVLAQIFFGSMVGLFGAAILLPARTIGWAMLGAGVGAAVGLANYSIRRALYGLLGGLIGGGIGGLLFDVFGAITGSGTISRLIGFAAIGAFTGAAVMLIEESRKTAWVTKLVGKNEGKQFIIDRQCARIGRDELLEIPVFGDTTVARLHAEIHTSDWRSFQIVDRTGTPTTLLNGSPITSANLKHGDTITIGHTNLVFGQKGAASVIPDFPWASAPMPNIPQQAPMPAYSSVCAFCGQPKDPVTGLCPCSPLVTPAQTLGVQTGTSSLVGIQGVYAGSVFTVASPSTIGRQEGSSITLNMDGGVSRRHATISLGPQGWEISDNNSSNGVYVNQTRVPYALIKTGDQIHIGGTTFEFRQN